MSPVASSEASLTLATDCGLEQGDPLSALSFCLTLGHAMDFLVRVFPAVACGAYVDDVVLVAPPPVLDEAFVVASPHMAQYGLLLRPAKSVFFVLSICNE